MTSFNRGVGKVEIALRWDPSPLGAPPHDLDLVAAAYSADDPRGEPAYLVHFDSRSPDGTITLQRHSHTGQGFGADEVLTLEFARISAAYARVVVGVAIQQNSGRLTFGEVAATGVQIRDDHVELAADDFAGVAGATAATVAEFVRGESGSWRFRPAVRGFDADPAQFTALMGTVSGD